jgi:hypothetical protein
VARNRWTMAVNSRVRDRPAALVGLTYSVRKPSSRRTSTCGVGRRLTLAARDPRRTPGVRSRNPLASPPPRRSSPAKRSATAAFRRTAGAEATGPRPRGRRQTRVPRRRRALHSLRWPHALARGCHQRRGHCPPARQTRSRPSASAPVSLSAHRPGPTELCVRTLSSPAAMPLSPPRCPNAPLPDGWHPGSGALPLAVSPAFGAPKPASVPASVPRETSSVRRSAFS